MTWAFLSQTSTWAIERAIRSARPKVPGLPEAFRFHDLRHYLASLLIGSGLDVKVVQHRLRHGSAKTTLDTYGHLFEDRLDTSYEALRTELGPAFNVARERTFTGFDNYRNVIESGVDMVILATPPGFRPLHFEAALV